MNDLMSDEAAVDLKFSLKFNGESPLTSIPLTSNSTFHSCLPA